MLICSFSLPCRTWSGLPPLLPFLFLSVCLRAISSDVHSASAWQCYFVDGERSMLRADEKRQVGWREGRENCCKGGRGEGRKCRERGEGRDEIVKVPLHFHAQGGVEKKLSCTISSSFISLSVLSRWSFFLYALHHSFYASCFSFFVYLLSLLSTTVCTTEANCYSSLSSLTTHSHSHSIHPHSISQLWLWVIPTPHSSVLGSTR